MVKTWLFAGVVLLAGPGLVGCSSGPTVSELGGQMQKDGTELLDRAAESQGVEGVKPTITDDASKDVPCGDGKVKRVFAGSFPFMKRDKVDTTFDLAFSITLGQLDKERYELTQEPDSDDLARREFVLTGKDDLKVTFTFTFTGGAAPAAALRGETACLKP
jgi:hypothetical protein